MHMRSEGHLKVSPSWQKELQGEGSSCRPGAVRGGGHGRGKHKGGVRGGAQA